jgi:hypothetical protein
MRCVVILFAEAHDLLPRDNRIYYDSYSLQGLREQLDRLAGGPSKDRLRHLYASWPAPDFPVPAGLFRFSP